jgi:prepilin-type N-terminal cleavage/methylation domain-containing protein
VIGRREDEGFTLVELLLVVAIMGVVMPAVVGVLLIFFRTAFVASVRTDRAFDANLLAAYLQPDLASTRSAPALSGVGCNSSMVLSWSQQNYLPNGPGTANSFVATYSVVAAASGDGPYLLRRVLQVDGVTTMTNTISHNLDTVCSAVFSSFGTSVVATVTQSDSSGQPTSSVLHFAGSSVGRS